MKKENKDGWWGVKPRTKWTCPECSVTTDANDWSECESYCEDCGSHDGRECPNCGEQFDHVWGDERIEDASAKKEGRG